MVNVEPGEACDPVMAGSLRPRDNPPTLPRPLKNRISQRLNVNVKPSEQARW